MTGTSGDRGNPKKGESREKRREEKRKEKANRQTAREACSLLVDEARYKRNAKGGLARGRGLRQ